MKSFEQHYQIDENRVYGRGAYGIVYKCIDLQDKEKKLCVKVVDYNQCEQNKIIRELKVMDAIITDGKINQNIVKVEMATLEKGVLYFVMEKCDQDLKIDLQDRLKNNKLMKFSEGLDCIKQILNGYKMLYEYGLMHRDIKPDNILIKFLNGQPIYKLADFGMAKLYKSYDKSEQTVKGTPIWASPQVFQGHPYSAKTDIYSLGLLFYFILFGQLPYGPYGSIKNRKELFDKQESLKYKPLKVDFSTIKERNDLNAQESDQLAQFLESLIKFEEEDRVDFTQLFSNQLINIKVQLKDQIDPTLFDSQMPAKQAPQQQQLRPNIPINTITPNSLQNGRQFSTLQPTQQNNQQIQQQPIQTTPSIQNQPMKLPSNALFPQGQINRLQVQAHPQGHIQTLQPMTQQQQQLIQIQPLQQPVKKIQLIVKVKDSQTLILENLERYINTNFQAEKTVLHIMYIVGTYFLKLSPMNSGHYKLYTQQLKIKYQDQRDFNFNAYTPVDLTKSLQQLYKQNIQLFPYQLERPYYQEYLRMLYFLEYVSSFQTPNDQIISKASELSGDPQIEIHQIIKYISIQRSL